MAKSIHSVLFLMLIVFQIGDATAVAQLLEPIVVTGKTMGTTYAVTYFDDQQRNFARDIDSLLVVLNQSINTYDPHSEVSRFNSDSTGFTFALPYLYAPLSIAGEVYKASNGAFDLTVMPLVNAWGFGPGKAARNVNVDSIRQFVGFDKVILHKDRVTKSDPRVQLDFGGIGQGYGADVITNFLQLKGVVNLLVELGGEGMAIGRNLKSGREWQIGITDPRSTMDDQFIKAYVSVSNRSYTTAGNYFNYRIVDGRRYSHTIDPTSGRPANRNILSASVFARDCTTADAWDTAFMVMGHQRAIRLLKKHPELDALILYTGRKGKIESYVTPGLRKFITIEP